MYVRAKTIYGQTLASLSEKGNSIENRAEESSCDAVKMERHRVGTRGETAQYVDLLTLPDDARVR